MSINSKRIAKNTLFLYLRMLLLMAITFYTLRIVLLELGAEDYGIYNIVGGIVIFLSFIQSAMMTAFQRFISYELGGSDPDKVHKAFKGGLSISIIFTICMIVILETLGLWAVNHLLKIPSHKIFAANLVYQLSIVAFIFNFLRIPYQALIISYEKMSFFSLISIVEGGLRLVTAFMISYFSSYRLVVYAGTVVGVSFVITFLYKFYCENHFKTAKYKWYWEKEQCKKILSFSGYSMGISVANITAQQGGNILLNYYAGVIANAAYGVANQVGAAIMSFASSFQTAFNPQITKLYANRDLNILFNLVIKSSVYSYLLILILAAPGITFMEWGLQLWLKNVPEYSITFCIWVIIYQMIDAMQSPLNMLIYATGEIKSYSIWLSIILALNVPLSLLFLFLGFNPILVLIIRVSINTLSSIIRTWYVNYTLNFPVGRYLKEILYKIIPLTTIAFCGCLSIKHIIPYQDNLISIVTAFIFCVVICFILGVNRQDKLTLVNYIKNKINTK